MTAAVIVVAVGWRAHAHAHVGRQSEEDEKGGHQLDSAQRPEGELEAADLRVARGQILIAIVLPYLVGGCLIFPVTGRIRIRTRT